MRLRVQFTAEGPVLLPWNYPELLMGLFYRWMRAGNYRLSRLLHDEGLRAQGHQYKPYTFSWLRGQYGQAEPTGIQLSPPLIWYVSSPIRNLMEALTQGIWRQPQVHLGRVPLTVVSVEVVPTITPLRQPIRIVTLSPIVASTVQADAAGNREKIFLGPEDPQFSRVIRENLYRKARALQVEVPEAEVLFLPVQVRSRLVRLHQAIIRAWEGEFLFEGPTKLFQVGYQAGFGERNGQGFGMVQIHRARRRQIPPKP